MTKEYIKLLMPELTRHKHLKQTDTESQSVSHLPVQATPVRVSLGLRPASREVALCQSSPTHGEAGHASFCLRLFLRDHREAREKSPSPQKRKRKVDNALQNPMKSKSSKHHKVKLSKS